MTALLDLRRRWHLLWLTVLTLLMTLPGLASIPVIDRDEARYATASVQMVESGDWLEIRFHDEARNKKPAGAYWAQSVMLSLASGADGLAAGERPLWAQRLPSVMAGLLAVWLTYFAALMVLGRGGALIAGSMLATALIFVFEAHIAKTDALLLASTTAVFLALVRLRAGRTRGSAWLFWISMGASVMIKGPIGLVIAASCLLSLILWEREAGWMKPLSRPLPILIFGLIWLPWLIAIDRATDGAFLAESLGRDLGGKMVGAQETHGGPPGYYALTIWITLWPACLMLLPGLAWAIGHAKGRTKGRSPAMDNDPKRRFARLCLAWVVPFWLMLELAPTKLIHYPLPLFPALCVMMAGAVLASADGAESKRPPRLLAGLSAGLFMLGALAIVGVIVAAQVRYGADTTRIPAFMAAGLSLGLSGLAAWRLLRGRPGTALASAGGAAVLMSLMTYGLLLPAIEDGRTSERLARAVDGPIASLHYTEPSLIYYAGTRRVRLGGTVDWANFATWSDAALVIDRTRHAETLQAVRDGAREGGLCLAEAEPVTGFKYSNFEAVELIPVRQVPCATGGP